MRTGGQLYMYRGTIVHVQGDNWTCTGGQLDMYRGTIGHVQVYNWTYIGTQLGVHRGKIVRVQGDITFASLPNADPAPNFG